MIIHANCLEYLVSHESNSIDAVVTDPPYGLSFMGKKWDYDVPSVEIWREVLRVLKPGGHLLSFGGTRTYHRLAVNIEDAGFEIRDQIMWIYGSGFPKSMDVSKAIDKQAGAEREVIGISENNRDRSKHNYNSVGNVGSNATITVPATESSKQWQGWGTALKPANEPIVVARKPLEKGLTVAVNIQKWGTGAINVDASRVGTERRWPANILFDEEAAAVLDKQGIHSKSRVFENRVGNGSGIYHGGFGSGTEAVGGYSDSGGPSRFFYVAKASKRERNAGLEGEIKQKQGARPNSSDSSGKFPDHDHRESGGNNHPTVKPVKLMEYIIKLVTPPNGVVMDPFMGSGTTGVAAKNLGFNFLGIEMNEEYVEIAKRRIG